MKQYIGTKLVQAKLMTRKEYNDLRGWKVPENENPDDNGYLIEDLQSKSQNHFDFKGYISWLPEFEFNESYKPNTGGLFLFAINDENGVYIGESDTPEKAKENALKIKETHTLADEFDFGMALHLLKAGQKVARKGWNGKGMYLLLVDGKCVTEVINNCYGDPERYEVGADGYEKGQSMPVLNAIYMKTADNKLVPWLASQTDVLAEDWVIVE
ncbi:DUF2829 domain-containing protein [Moraxella sp. ZY210820]|uniref:DUF2829 domain-containing protein n=1 Tax=Moraxella sp. ZY210820 TaxID=2904123 RepID=UPI002730158C|nr:DUF2829 domain-containing protein [Moraxella sp. ZY210820]WLF84830.1 DUF2829 domain-containing protein [Moraxella sp. ZY210820]